MATGFLVTNLKGTIKQINEIVNKHVLKTLYIQVYSKPSNTGIQQWVTKEIFSVYTSASKLFPNLDVRIILHELKNGTVRKNSRNFIYDVDVIILPKNYHSAEITQYIENNKNLSVVLLEDAEENEELKNDNILKIYDNVVLGGTFDRLHAGHKILLSQALLQCSNSLTVGVTDSTMIKSKILWELIESCEERIKNVQTFIEQVDNTVECKVVPISDAYGPTKSDPNLKMIVVSAETEKGAQKVNELRQKNGLSILDVCIIDIAEESSPDDEEELKISSSNLRKRLLGTRIKSPEEKPSLPDRPYLIGLTGGICSGKSNIGKHLESLGAGLIDCDKIAHKLYKCGNPAFNDIVKLFGCNIVGSDGEIDRRKLGDIVFNNAEKLNQLNQLLWPKILQAATEESLRLYKEQNKNIVVLEAAVLLQARWDKNVHEVWTVIIPPEEAIARLMKRNNLTEDQAKSRIQSQPSNLDQLSIANVVFCSLWSYEYTRKQVDRAWDIVNK